MADQTNPYTQLGMMGMMMPNPYTQYKGQLPMPGYMGTPTDTEGSPIQSFTDAQAQHDTWDKANPAPAPGTTLNSTPSNVPQFIQAPGGTVSGGAASTNAGMQGGQWVPGQMIPNPAYSAQQQQAPAAPAAPTNPVDMRQAYLTALSNPGNPKMPGANVPEAQPLGTPSVLNSFLAAHPGGGTAAPAGGGYSNKGFFDTLNQLRSA